MLRQRLTDNGCGALPNGFLDIFMSIHLGSPQCHKQVTGLHLSGIYLYALYLSAFLAHCLCGLAVLYQLVQFHIAPIYYI